MIVFDLDDTLRDTRKSNFLAPKGKSSTSNYSWFPWQVHVNQHGFPIEPIAQLFKSMGSDVIVVTSSVFGSYEWLYRHGLFPAYVVERDVDDHRTPYDLKVDFILRHLGEIDLWVDDNIEVLDFVESLGIPTVRVKKCTMVTGTH